MMKDRRGGVRLGTPPAVTTMTQAMQKVEPWLRIVLMFAGIVVSVYISYASFAQQDLQDINRSIESVRAEIITHSSDSERHLSRREWDQLMYQIEALTEELREMRRQNGVSKR